MFDCSWTTTEGKATSSALNCPPADGLTCGMSATPKMVRITGIARKSAASFGCEDDNDNEWHDFEIVSPEIVSTADEGADGDGSTARVDFSGCILDCENKEACQVGIDEGYSVCPDTEDPEALKELAEEAFESIGGSVGAQVGPVVQE